MKLLKIFLSFTLFFFILSCSKEVNNKSVIKEKSLDLQVMEAYNEGKKSLETGDVLFAAKKFNEAELLFPQSEWAPKSALMAAYSYYSQDYYGDAIAELNRFLRVYPNYKHTDYVYFLLGLSYYEQIIDEKKDLQSIIKAKEYFEIVKQNFSKTEYALDAEFKIEYINDILASKEMYIGRYYIEREKWIPAINRFRTVVDKYETTIYTEEALYRLVEIYYKLGNVSLAKKYAATLGYNFNDSNWYKKTYKIVADQNYQEDTKATKRKLRDKIKNIFKLSK